MSWGSSFIPALFPDDSLTHHLNTHTHSPDQGELEGRSLHWCRRVCVVLYHHLVLEIPVYQDRSPWGSPSTRVEKRFLFPAVEDTFRALTAQAETRRWGMRQRLQFFLNVNRLQPSSSQVFLNVSWIMTVLCSQLMILTSAKTNRVSGVCVPGLWGREHQDDRWWRFRSLASATNLTFKSLRIVVFYWL